MSPVPLSVKTVLFAIIGLVALPCVGIIIHTGLHHRDEVIEDAGAETRRVVGRIVAEQQNLTAATEQLLSTLGRLPEVADKDAPRTGAILAGLVQLNPQYANLLIADTLGNVWCSGIPAPLPLSIADRRHFKNALAGGRLSSSEYLIGRTTNRPAISYAYPYRGHNGAIAGVIVATLNLDYYQGIVDQLKLPDKTGLLLVDHRGIIIYASRGASPRIGVPLRADLYRRMVGGRRRGPAASTAWRGTGASPPTASCASGARRSPTCTSGSPPPTIRPWLRPTPGSWATWPCCRPFCSWRPGPPTWWGRTSSSGGSRS
ncbi:hypothetical protein FO488_04865 [Geobacter sp. FeAm09]|uniref:PDC sensor domain-containing protein n=1 Tax=Geobacter sp. FeAm09 TaxID=2597769 RepID=UPI0011EF03D9|nr:cache domain-containing protein [Geobacter sp. FeAm09]QEM67544.1 hypothetical protein FO488_04865 [Geobacter sp. FeAm09]